MDAPERLPLTLTWQGGRAVLDDRRAKLTLGARLPVGRLPAGRPPDDGVQVGGAACGPYTSRRHATIERRKHSYVLIDHSTNGTWVQTEDERVAFVRRGEVRLWGEGWISLGAPLAPESAIRFRLE